MCVLLARDAHPYLAPACFTDYCPEHEAMLGAFFFWNLWYVRLPEQCEIPEALLPSQAANLVDLHLRWV